MSAIDTQGAAHADGHGDGHDDHDHDHPPFLAHHWDNPKQQFEAGKLGMWLFLATEFLLFGGLFCAYAVYRHNQPELFAWGAEYLDTKYGAINTVILILSSLTMAMAVTTSQLGKKNATVALLIFTFFGGAGFMGIKYIEYKHKFEVNTVWGTGLYEPIPEDGAMPEAYVGGQVEMPVAGPTETSTGVALERSAIAPPAEAPTGIAIPVDGQTADDAEEHAADHAEDGDYDPFHGAPNPRTDPRPKNAHVFFGIYFCMTGLHGAHVLIGMGVIAWLAFRAARGEFGPEYFTPVDLGGLYWHVVDLIWIFLFPLLYLI